MESNMITDGNFSYYSTGTVNFTVNSIPTELQRVTIFCVSLLLALVAVVGNLFVICAYIRSNEIKSLPFNVYIFHLSIADLLVGLHNLPLQGADYLGRWILPIPLIISNVWLSNSVSFMSLVIIIIMSLDRYQLVTDTFTYYRIRTRKANVKLMIKAWIFSVVYSLLYILFAAWSVQTDYFPKSIIIPVLFQITQIVINFLLPLITLLIINMMVFIKFSKHMRWSHEINLRQSHRVNWISSNTRPPLGITTDFVKHEFETNLLSTTLNEIMSMNNCRHILTEGLRLTFLCFVDSYIFNMETTYITQSNFSYSTETVNLAVLDIPSDLQRVTIFCVSMVLALVAVVGNLFVIYAYLRSNEVRSLPFNVYIFHLSVADLLVGLHNLPMEAIELLVGGWTLPLPLEMSSLWLSTSVTYMSLVIIIIMSLDRYQLVTDTFTYYRNRTRKANVKLMIKAWIFAVLYCFIFSIFALFTVTNFYRRHSLFSRATFTIAQLILNFFIPVIALLTINVLVYVKLNKHTRWSSEVLLKSHRVLWISSNAEEMTITPTTDINHQTEDFTKSVKTDYLRKHPSETFQVGDNIAVSSAENQDDITLSSVQLSVNNSGFVTENTVNPEKDKSKPPKRIGKIVWNLFVFVSVYLICWLPVHVLFVWRLIVFVGDESFWDEIALFFLYANSALNPFIYANMNLRYRKYFTEVLQSFCHSKNSSR
ncbi:alpha-2 adrenergic receptor-like [Apostichopus japonicus]|uniref:alpha-2 adrenergic receptor-like n=1 Tax=Stichopus japonicus TaxID=307972 RepID=UPI003AB19841